MAIFLGIARMAHQHPDRAPADLSDLRAVALPLDPPPPPDVVHEEDLPPTTNIANFEASLAESPVKITVVPPDLAAMMPPPQAAPPASIQVGQLYQEFRPKLAMMPVEKKIYQAVEVDELPKVLDRVLPQVSRRVRDDAESLHVTLIFVVDIDGTVRNVRLLKGSGNREFDDIMTQNIQQWTFSPAIRKGVRVRCLIQQSVTVVWQGGSPFQL